MSISRSQDILFTANSHVLLLYDTDMLVQPELLDALTGTWLFSLNMAENSEQNGFFNNSFN